MNAGSLRHSIQVQARQQTGVGDRGQPVLTWQTTATVPGAVEDLTGRKLEVARQQVAEASHEVTIRYLPGMTTKGNRLLVNGRTFNIGAIRNRSENNFTLVLTCVEQEGR